MFAELVERAWSSNTGNLTSTGGSAYERVARGRKYLYWQPPTIGGKRASPLYIGKDDEKSRKRIQALADTAANLRERRDMVRALRNARLHAPDKTSGDVMAAMAEAGVFRLRAVVVGSVAFQTYPGLLGMRMPAALSRTGDLDVGQFQSIAVAVEDRIASDLETVLRKVDDRFTAVPDAFDGRRTMRYAIRRGQDEIFSVDILSPMRGPELPRIGSLPAIRSDAQFLRYLDFLLYQEVNSVALHGAGIPINVPDPTRYALHKLTVSQMRLARDARSQAKARKDLQQAASLITVLAEARPDDLRNLWLELCERGPSWRRKAMQALSQLPPEIAAALGADLDPGRGDRDAASAYVVQAGDEIDETGEDTVQPTWDA
ncbi:GSU2403 family nucleotidyltransferase fold protein [Methylobacterium sp. DCY52]|uniref:GSU2403 family nucleotidyltransferase fold protein n=1 Tax=Methylobacterium sp. DCY52 TaxID=739139 RepID=UPI003144D8A5